MQHQTFHLWNKIHQGNVWSEQGARNCENVLLVFSIWPSCRLTTLRADTDNCFTLTLCADHELSEWWRWPLHHVRWVSQLGVLPYQHTWSISGREIASPQPQQVLAALIPYVGGPSDLMMSSLEQIFHPLSTSCCHPALRYGGKWQNIEHLMTTSLCMLFSARFRTR